MIVAGLILSMLYWIVDSALHASSFHGARLSARLLTYDAHELWMRLMVVCIIVGFSAYAQRAVRRRTEAESALRKTQDRYRELVQNANSVILRMDTQGRIVFINEYGQQFFGYTEGELIGQPLVGLIVPPKDAAGRDLSAMVQGIREHPARYVNNENENVRKNGQRVWISWTNKAIRDDNGDVVGILCIGNDITQRKRAEERLEEALSRVRDMSLVDELTGLNNRRAFLTLAQQQLRAANRTKQRICLLFADLDNMKWINDTLGHNAGDEALIRAAKVLKKTFRESDIVARIGGDEFAVLAIDGSFSDEFPANRIRANLKAHNAGQERLYKVELSVGMAFYDPESPCSIEELLSKADERMYQEKRQKRGSRIEAQQEPVHREEPLHSPQGRPGLY